MGLIRCYAGIYGTSRKTVSGGFHCGKEKKKKKTRFSSLYKNYLAIRSHNNQEPYCCQDLTLFNYNRKRNAQEYLQI